MTNCEVRVSIGDDIHWFQEEIAVRLQYGSKMMQSMKDPIMSMDFDLDNPEFPSDLEKTIMQSDGYPYKKKLKRSLYEEELERLQIELVKVQEWVRQDGKRIVVVFEGRDAAGKGGSIKVMTQYTNPRHVRVVALSKPSDVEQGQWYFQRYAQQLPTRGEITLFDRSWYNRAGVEPVMGFCTPEQTSKFLKDAPSFEQMVQDSGTILFKFWLNIGRDMQLKRFHDQAAQPVETLEIVTDRSQGAGQVGRLFNGARQNACRDPFQPVALGGHQI